MTGVGPVVGPASFASSLVVTAEASTLASGTASRPESAVVGGDSASPPAFDVASPAEASGDDVSGDEVPPPFASGSAVADAAPRSKQTPTAQDE